jgi:hypothetical protein
LAELTEISDAEHLFEYARQMVRCDAEMDAASAYFAYEIEADLHGQTYREMNKLTEMVAGLTTTQREEG